MIVTEQINQKLEQMPVSAQKEVLDFVDFLIHKLARREKTELMPEQKSAALEQWANSHRSETPVILDDRREVIYED